MSEARRKMELIMHLPKLTSMILALQVMLPFLLFRTQLMSLALLLPLLLMSSVARVLRGPLIVSSLVYCLQSIEQLLPCLPTFAIENTFDSIAVLRTPPHINYPLLSPSFFYFGTTYMGVVPSEKERKTSEKVTSTKFRGGRVWAVYRATLLLNIPTMWTVSDCQPKIPRE